MKTTETTPPRNSDLVNRIERLRDDKCQLSMSERTLLADMLARLLKSGADLLLSLKIAHTAVDERTRTRAALWAVIQHLQTCGVSVKLWDPLHALWCALADADRGISNELIDRVAYRGGTQKTFRDTVDWATAAAKVTLLIKDKVPARAALERVAKAQGLDSKKLREYRKNIQRGHAPLRAQKYYGWCLEDLADPKGAKRRRIQRELADSTESDFASLLALIAELRKG